MNTKKKIRKKLIIEGLFALIIAISPLIFYAYKYIPINSENTWNFLGITFTNNGYQDITVAFYFYLSKLIPLSLLMIWFITCKRWWYHAILIPVAMYSFQLYNVFSEDAEKIDENELFYLLIVCMVVIPIVYFVRIKLYDKYVHGIDLEAMEAELKSLKDKQVANTAKEKKSNEEIPYDSKKYHTLTEKIEHGLSTQNIERQFKKLQHSMRSFLHL